ncbi:MAG TPA: 6,7-dimethyl-8-ribityllumazine synthase [Mycobacteriales bacterium]|nr:6,7-dimethyl-8-ribityllumazine synthase [Mycobacteriales bacterium]
MSGEGRPDGAVVDASGLRLGVALTKWNAEIVGVMLDRALLAAERCGVTDPLVVQVAGAVELPVVVQELARQCDAVVALGAVIRGGTPHFDYVCRSVTDGLTRVALDERVPVGNGVLTCDTVEQARARNGGPGSTEDKGWEATVAALDTALVINGLRHRPGRRPL